MQRGGNEHERRIREAEDRARATANRLREELAEIDRLKAQRDVMDLSPEERRRQWKIIRGGAAVAAAGAIVGAAQKVREAVTDHPLPASAAIAALSAGSLLFSGPPVGDGEVREPAPPRAADALPGRPEQPSASASPATGRPTLEEPGVTATVVSSQSSGEDAAPRPTAPPQTEPSASPSPVPTQPPRPTPSPTAGPPGPPEPTATGTPSPTSSPTVEPPVPTAPPSDDPLVCVEVDEVAGVCLDVPLVDDVLDGVHERRYRVR